MYLIRMGWRHDATFNRVLILFRPERPQVTPRLYFGGPVIVYLHMRLES